VSNHKQKPTVQCRIDKEQYDRLMRYCLKRGLVLTRLLSISLKRALDKKGAE
jgi:hypothetical protein